MNIIETGKLERGWGRGKYFKPFCFEGEGTEFGSVISEPSISITSDD